MTARVGSASSRLRNSARRASGTGARRVRGAPSSKSRVRVAPGSVRSERADGSRRAPRGRHRKASSEVGKLPAARTRRGWSKGVGWSSGWSTARAKSARTVEPGEESVASLRSTSSTSKPPETARRAREGSSETGPTGPSTSTSAPGSGAVESGIAIGPACEATAPYQSLGSTGTASSMRKARMHETHSTRRPRGTSRARVPMVTTPVGTTRARSSFTGV